MACKLACKSSRQSTPAKLREQILDCARPLAGNELRELDTFDWSLLNTPATIQRKQKSGNIIHKKCTQKLRAIEQSFGVPTGLSYLIDGTKALMAKEWKTFMLYTDYDDREPEDKKWWSKIQMAKWDLVEWFTMTSCQYHSQIEQAANEGVELDCEETDEEVLGLLEVVLELDADESDVVSIKEWERFGTKATLELRELMSSDLASYEVDADDTDDDLEEEEAISNWELTLTETRPEPFYWEFHDALMDILLSQAQARTTVTKDKRRDLT